MTATPTEAVANVLDRAAAQIRKGKLPNPRLVGTAIAYAAGCGVSVGLVRRSAQPGSRDELAQRAARSARDHLLGPGDPDLFDVARDLRTWAASQDTDTIPGQLRQVAEQIRSGS